jgi:hypothetical protein
MYCISSKDGLVLHQLPYSFIGSGLFHNLLYYLEDNYIRYMLYYLRKLTEHRYREENKHQKSSLYISPVAGMHPYYNQVTLEQ